MKLGRSDSGSTDAAVSLGASAKDDEVVSGSRPVPAKEFTR